MADGSLDLDELVDLKMLPAWVSEPPPAERYAEHAGEDREGRRGRDRRPRDRRGSDRKGPKREFGRAPSKQGQPDRPQRHDRDRKIPRGRDRHRQDRHHRRPKRPAAEKPLPPIAVKFLPRAAAFENVVEQIKSGAVAYSLFALARLFLEKAPRHDVQLTAPEGISLFQLGENGAISVDRSFLERNAFHATQNDFYKIDITETEPIKGSFTNVARDRLSGTLLGPTNHHDYQRRLRNLYEQRFSRRMSFGDFRRQIQIVTDPAEIEKWKEDARKVTTFTTLREEPPQTFSSAAEAKKHFNQHYLPDLTRLVSEVTIDGPASRRLHDRVLNRVIENEWTRESRSPSPMMQELAARFREASLHVFRHRRGMLFVSSIYPRLLTKEQTAVSAQVRTIVDAIEAQPRIGRKELADKLMVDLTGEEAERAKLALASDLLWLISAGHVIEFNDGSLDLPRSKAKKPKEEAADPAEAKENADAAASAADKEARVEAGAPADRGETVVAAVSAAREEPTKQTEQPTEIGGS
ncbi:MAG: hypothetical protein JO201_02830 [Verrucomicrobia bacterium]|nr:hypothetical protein [Verrucomicrobiota bacterium]